MEQKDNFIGQYKFDDFFNKTAAMLKYTWKDSLLLLAIVLLPLTLLASLGISQFIDLLEPFVERALRGTFDLDDFNFSEFIPLLSQILLWYFILSLAYWIVDLFINASISSIVFNKIRGESKPLPVVATTVLSKYLGKLVLQSLLFSLIILGISLAFGIVIGITIVIAALTKSSAATILIVILAYLSLFVLLIWLTNRLAFGLQALIFEDQGPAESLKKSSQLVKGHWWRVWGFIIFASLIIGFASSMITGPIFGAFMLPAYARMFENLLEGNQDYIAIYRSFLSYLPKIWVPLMLTFLLQSALQYFILPVFRSLFYIDLKVRKNELNPPGPSASDQETLPPNEGNVPPPPTEGPGTGYQS